jgi:hypothetical protein
MANGWPNGGGDIIIRGGSVDLIFDEGIYQKSPANPKRHENANRKIVKILILDENGSAKFDSGDSQNGLKWTITVSTN